MTIKSLVAMVFGMLFMGLATIQEQMKLCTNDFVTNLLTGVKS